MAIWYEEDKRKSEQGRDQDRATNGGGEQTHGDLGIEHDSERKFPVRTA